MTVRSGGRGRLRLRIRDRRRFGEAAAFAGVVEAVAVVGVGADEALGSDEEDVLAVGAGVIEGGAAGSGAGADQVEVAGRVLVDVVGAVYVGGDERAGAGEEDAAVVEDVAGEVGGPADALGGEAGGFRKRGGAGGSAAGGAGGAAQPVGARVVEVDLRVGLAGVDVGVFVAGEAVGGAEAEVPAVGRDPGGEAAAIRFSHVCGVGFLPVFVVGFGVEGGDEGGEAFVVEVEVRFEGHGLGALAVFLGAGQRAPRRSRGRSRLRRRRLVAADVGGFVQRRG